MAALRRAISRHKHMLICLVTLSAYLCLNRQRSLQQARVRSDKSLIPPLPPPHAYRSSAADIFGPATETPALPLCVTSSVFSSFLEATTGRAAAVAAAVDDEGPAAPPPALLAVGMGECGNNWRGRKSRVTLAHLTCPCLQAAERGFGVGTKARSSPQGEAGWM